MVQYFAQWAVYDRDFYPADMRVDLLTHVHYAFFDVTSACQVATLDSYADYELIQFAAGQSVTGNLAAFRALREEQAALGHELKLDISLGGWTKSTYFSQCAAAAASRGTLVASAVQLLADVDFDGIDVDWEYPVQGGLASNGYSDDDWDNYLLLLAEMRAALDAQWPDVHKGLSIAMGMPEGVTGLAAC